MKQKIRVALIYKSDYTFFNKNHFDQTTYYFFMNSLERNNELEIKYIPCKTGYDCSKLKSNTDVILLANDNTDATPDELINLKESQIPVICRAGDPHWAKKYNHIQFHEKCKIDYYFNFMHEDYFYKFYPKDFNYKTITLGIEPVLFENLDFNLKNRIPTTIVNSGALGKNTLKSKIANRILNPKRSGWYFYKLRTKCNDLYFVIHTRELEKKFPGSTYYEILSKYCAAIAATTYYPTIKYWETSAAGCLTFMEISKLNRGNYLGYQDNKTAIFINEKNYLDKFHAYLSDYNNPKWAEIANAGREYTMKKFSNDNAVKELVNLMKNII